jgi:membrane associated rhomboid family serine protease
MIDLLALRFFNSPFFSIYQLGTYMFMHSGFQHLLFNMLGLVFGGAMLEQVWGSQKFLFYYVVCGVGAGLLYLAVNYFQLSFMQADMEAFMAHPAPADLADFMSRYASDLYKQNLDFINNFSKNRDNQAYIDVAKRTVEAIYTGRLNTPMIGASGAVYGVLLAFGMIFPNMTMVLFPIPIPIKAKYLVLLFGVMTLYGVFSNSPGDNVAHLAHLGGMLVGWILLLFWGKGHRPETYQ